MTDDAERQLFRSSVNCAAVLEGMVGGWELDAASMEAVSASSLTRSDIAFAPSGFTFDQHRNLYQPRPIILLSR
jgi:hypothetical protein